MPVRIEAFMTSIKKTPMEKIAERCEEERTYLKQFYVTSSLKRALTLYRNSIRASKMSKDRVLEILKTLKLNDDEQAEFKSTNRKNVKDNLWNLRPLRNIDCYIELCQSLLEDQSFLAKATGLCGLTGRRSVEIFCTAKFERTKNEYSAIFTGQRKTGLEIREGYEIPLLAPFSAIDKAIKELRVAKPEFIILETDSEKIVNEKIRKFQGSTSKNLFTVCKRRTFNSIEDGFNIKSLRAVYAELCYAQYNDPSVADDAYYASILGHSENDVTTAQAYRDFYIDDPAWKIT